MRVDELFFLEKYNLEAKVKNSPEHIWVDPHPCLVFLVFDPFSFTSIIVKSRWFSSVQLLSGVRLFATPWITTRQDSLPSPTPGVYSNSCPLSWWCHPAIPSSVIPFSSCPQSLPASGLFQWVNSSHEVAKVLEFQLQSQSFKWTPRTDLL